MAVFDLKPGGADRHFAVDVADGRVGGQRGGGGRRDIRANRHRRQQRGRRGSGRPRYERQQPEWHRVWDINVVGMARVYRAALPHLRVSPSAAVVNVASIVATAGVPQRVLYSATKEAVLSMTRAMAADHVRGRHPLQRSQPRNR